MAFELRDTDTGLVVSGTLAAKDFKSGSHGYWGQARGDLIDARTGEPANFVVQLVATVANSKPKAAGTTATASKPASKPAATTPNGHPRATTATKLDPAAAAQAVADAHTVELIAQVLRKAGIGV